MFITKTINTKICHSLLVKNRDIYRIDKRFTSYKSLVIYLRKILSPSWNSNSINNTAKTTTKNITEISSQIMSKNLELFV